MIIVEVSLSFSEILAFTVIMGSIVSVWVGVKVKIQKIETTTHIKFVEFERQLSDMDLRSKEWMKGAGDALNRFVNENKEEHRELSHDTKNIRNSLQLVNERLAVLTGRTNE